MNLLPTKKPGLGRTRKIALVVLTVAALALPLTYMSRARAAGCTAPSTDYGSTTSSFSATNAGTYLAWSRIMAPDSTNNSYLLEVDGTSCYVVGDSAISTNTWTWVDYQNGSSSSLISLNLSAGTHNIKLIGREPGVKVDRVLFLSDQSCTPTNTGDNCTVIADTTPPTVSLTTPVDGATVTGTVNVAATADDTGGSGVAKVEFYTDGSLRGTDTTAPYTYTWDTTVLANGAHSVMTKAYDKVNNVNSATSQVTVQNGDKQAPTVPTNLKASAAAYNKVNLTWTASTDNVGVTGYTILRNGNPIAQVNPTTTYSDITVSANTAYTYQVTASDAAGNISGLSGSALITTPNPPDTTPPTVPTNLAGTAVSSNQVNLTWTASTDNIGVTDYDVYRSTSSAAATKIASSTTTTFGDSGLTANTAYTYYLIARDAAGNSSAQSTKVTVTTQQTPTVSTGSVQGTITNARSGSPIASARATLYINGTRRTYTANSQGYYLIPDIPAGTYSVRYHLSGYRAKTYTLVVKAGSVLTNNVALTPRR